MGRIRERKTVRSLVRCFSLNQKFQSLFSSTCSFWFNNYSFHLVFIIVILQISPHISITVFFDVGRGDRRDHYLYRDRDRERESASKQPNQNKCVKDF